MDEHELTLFLKNKPKLKKRNTYNALYPYMNYKCTFVRRL